MTRSRRSRSSPSARSPAARRQRASSSPRRFLSTRSRGSPARSIETVGRTDLRSRLRILAGASPPPARRGRAGRADARGPARRGGRAGAGARRPLARGWRACRGPRRSKQWRDRVMFLRRAEGEAWPDLSDEALAADPGWLAPFLTGKTRLDEIGADDLANALGAASSVGSGAPPRRRGADAFPRADRDGGADRLRSRGRAGDRAARAGIVRAQGSSVAGRRAHSAHARASFARPSADPDHARPAGLLARLLGRRPRRPPRPLPPPFLARGPRAPPRRPPRAKPRGT